jgi:hypothetical protein
MNLSILLRGIGKSCTAALTSYRLGYGILQDRILRRMRAQFHRVSTESHFPDYIVPPDDEGGEA